MNNIFVTGKRRVGKTTIIKKIILQQKLSPGGFMVEREGSEGNWTSFSLNNAENAIFKEGRPSLLKPFAKRDSKGPWEIDPMVFNQEGVSLLEKDFCKRDIIIMDELGRFEREALPFQRKVEEILSRKKPALGAIKEERNAFLDRIRERRDIEIFYVTEENREEVLLALLRRFKEIFAFKSR